MQARSLIDLRSLDLLALEVDCKLVCVQQATLMTILIGRASKDLESCKLKIFGINP